MKIIMIYYSVTEDKNICSCEAWMSFKNNTQLKLVESVTMKDQLSINGKLQHCIGTPRHAHACSQQHSHWVPLGGTVAR